MKQYLFSGTLVALALFSFAFGKSPKAPSVGSEPFIGEIMLFSGNFEPKGWAFCDGRLLPISQYSALFSILGTTYGGNGTTQFALPDLRGRVPIGQGQGAGLSNYYLGETGGQESVALTTAQMPAHSHTFLDAGLQLSEKQQVSVVAGTSKIKVPVTPGGPGSSSVTQSTGSGQPHENRQPYVGINYVIALDGVYPPRN